jgi:hypothetical protein
MASGRVASLGVELEADQSKRTEKGLSQQPSASSAPGALAFMSMPFTFTQDDLLNTRGFIDEAKKRGYELTLDDLQTLHNNRLLLPLYRISDTPVIGRRMNVVPNGNLNDRYRAMEAAADGRLHDSANEGYSAAWPYRLPTTAQGERWWNGFLYSSWQLLDLHLVTADLAWLHRGLLDRAVRARIVQQRHRRTFALTALAPRFLPGILRHIKLPPGMDSERIQRYRFESDVLELLNAVGFDPARLKNEAEALLGNAHMRDPLAQWLPLIRHASYSAWSKLRAEPLHCLWLRIGAEVLLRAHEDLAASGHMEPLPDVTGVFSLLHRRLGQASSDTDTLEEALGSFGLSPHPRVLLLVEGKSELKHLPPLLSEFGLDQPERVRVQQLQGASDNPHLLARYAVAPRIGRELGGGRQLAATPTALVIAIDPENRWTPKRLEDERKKIKQAIREVALQGAQIGQQELDFLVNIHVWDQEYEFANFTDEELLSTITTLASGPHAADKESIAWQEETRQGLEAARQERRNIDSVTGPLRIKKPALAEAMWPSSSPNASGSWQTIHPRHLFSR